MMSDPRRERLDELLALQAMEGLSSDEVRELDQLLELFPHEDAEALELAAAALHLAMSPPLEALPESVAEKLYAAANRFTPRPTVPATKTTSSSQWLAWSGWVVAALLLIALVSTHWPRPTDSSAPPPSLAELRDQLKLRATEFVGQKNQVVATIVWSDQEQIGYMEVQGLPPLDPQAGTYQLWIVDGERPKGSPPVDGGVFRVNPDGTVLVPIRPPIQVKKAAAFAITRETDPGGVVVSQVKPEDYEVVLTKKS
ncbi:MAG: anti-sigma factor [Gemmataceae bacterium]|nr:anti-sigma factor [Gemmata sp.]MDW8197020.1 anti-sigma factor [Gemmataceae bacterium]